MNPSGDGGARWTPAPIDEQERRRVLELASSPEAEAARADLVAAFRILVRMGVVDGLYQGLYGHLTLRVPGAPGYFWVNSLAKRFRDVTAGDLILLGSGGQIVQGEARAVNFAAFFIHSAIHRARADVNCVAHTHPAAGCAFAALGLPLLPIDQVGCVFFEDHAVHSDYSGVVAERSEGEAIAAALGSRRAAILVNHGLVTCGPDVAHAVIDMYELERTCDIQLRAMATGRELRVIPAEAARQVRSIRTDPRRYRHEWSVLMRELISDSRGVPPPRS
ncbi:MAG TPA: class II aldolase/adducin family protein [Candidatus Saccharimonadales bacterium]|nr:class II aldolase/adducin family protein [Candidatus Saccharimonadales bacterium]